MSCVNLNIPIRNKNGDTKVILLLKERSTGTEMISDLDDDIPSTPGFYKRKFISELFDLFKITVYALFSVVPTAINDFYIDGVPMIDQKYILEKNNELAGSGQFSTILKFNHKEDLVVKYPSNERESIMNYEELQNYFILGHHPSLLEVRGFSVFNSRLCPIYEYYSNGNLSSFIKNKGMTMIEKAKAIYGISSVLVFMHSRGFIYRDLKPENILINESHEIVLCDMNISRRSSEEKDYTQDVGTTNYMAPEVSSSSDYDFKCDIYSAAKVFEFILCDGREFVPIIESFEKYNRYSINPYELIMYFVGQKDPRDRFVLDFIMFLIEEEIFELGEYNEQDRKNLKRYIKKQKQFYNASLFRNDLYEMLQYVKNYNIFNIGFLLFRSNNEFCVDFFKLGENLEFEWCSYFVGYLQINEKFIALNYDENGAGQEKYVGITQIDVERDKGYLNMNLILSSANPHIFACISNLFYETNNITAFLFFIKLAAHSGDDLALMKLFIYTKSNKYLLLSIKLRTKYKFELLWAAMPKYEQAFISEAINGNDYFSDFLGLYYYYNKNYIESIKYFKMINDDEFYHKKYYWIAMAYFHLNDEENMIRNIKNGSIAGDQDCLLFQGMYYYEGYKLPQDKNQAYIYYLFTYSTRVQSAYMLAKMHFKGEIVEKNEEKSIKYMHDFFDCNKKSDEAWLCYARILYKWERYNEAMDICCGAIKNRKDSEIYFIIGMIYLKTGQVKEGLELLEYMCNRGMLEAKIKLGRYCLKKYLSGDKYNYYWKCSFETFVFLIQNCDFKNFYEFFSIIDDNDKNSFETILREFVLVCKNIESDKIFEFLLTECLKRGFRDLVELIVHPLISYYSIGYVLLDNNDISKIRYAKEYFFMAAKEGDQEAIRALVFIFNKHPDVFIL